MTNLQFFTSLNFSNLTYENRQKCNNFNMPEESSTCYFLTKDYLESYFLNTFTTLKNVSRKTINK